MIVLKRGGLQRWRLCHQSISGCTSSPLPCLCYNKSSFAFLTSLPLSLMARGQIVLRTSYMGVWAAIITIYNRNRESPEHSFLSMKPLLSVKGMTTQDHLLTLSNVFRKWMVVCKLQKWCALTVTIATSTKLSLVQSLHLWLDAAATSVIWLFSNR
jgi:hypothetical protein